MDALLTRSGVLRTGDVARRNAATSVVAAGGGLVVLADGREGTKAVSYAEIYETQPIVSAMVDKIVRNVATLPIRVYRRENRRRVRLDDHPLAELLQAPAPGCSAIDLLQWLLFPALVHGNSLVAKYRGNGPDRPPTGLVPLDWRFVTGWAAQGLPVEYWETTQLGGRDWLDAHGAIHVAWQSATGREIGVSPLKKLGTTLRLEDSAERYMASSFANGARPSGVISLPVEADLDPEEKQEMREAVQLMHGGVDNAFRVGLMSGGASWVAMAHTAVEAELIKAREVNRQEASMVFDVKPPAYGDMANANFSNLVEVNRDFYRTSGAGPWIGLATAKLQAQLVDPEPEWEGIFLAIDRSEVLKGDPKEYAEAQQIEISSGTLTPQEAREQQNRDPYPDEMPENAAERLYLPIVSNFAPLGAVAPKVPGASDPSAPGDAGPPLLEP